MIKTGCLVEAQNNIVGTDKVLPKNAIGVIRSVTPVNAEIYFDGYGVWWISQKTILDGAIEPLTCFSCDKYAVQIYDDIPACENHLNTAIDVAERA